VTTPPPTDPLIGTTVSQYEIVAKLGGGGMGVVYKARDVKLGRSVALKFLPPQWSHDEGAKQRFVREAQAASATNHRNICVIHNIDETADGRLFIVMAYYEGETLKQKLERGPLPIIEAIEIASEIADGLAKAHAQGVVHRDVKPGNLIVTEDGVKILDFGLAKFADALQLTVPGSTIGTVGYMSPEQARGEEADARSDVWALGIVMFEMLTGAVPFRGTYQEATFHAIKHEPPPSLRAARPDIPDALERIVMKALEKDPEKRFQNAREPARDLKLLAGRTVPVDLLTIEVTRPAGVGPDSLPRLAAPRRIFTPARSGIFVALLIVIAAGVYFWMARPIERVAIAIAPVINQTGYTELDAYRLGLTNAFIRELEGSPYVRVIPYSRLLEMIGRFLSTGADPSSREALEALASRSRARFVIVPTLGYESGGWHAQIEIRLADTATNVAVYRTDRIVSSLPKETAYSLTLRLTQDVQSHFQSIAPRRRRFLDAIQGVLRRQVQQDRTQFHSLDAAAEFERGMRAYEQLDYATARRTFQVSTELDPQSPLAFAWLSHVALILRQDVFARQTAEKARQLLAPQTPVMEAIFVDAIVEEADRNFEGAEAKYQQLSDAQLDQSNWLLELGSYQYRRALWSEGVATYRQALSRDADFVRPHLELCRLYNRLHEEVKAKQEGDAALNAYRGLANVNGEAQALMCLTDALQFGTAQQRAEAMNDARGAVEICDQSGDGYNLARAQYYVALASEALGRPLEAVKAYEAAIETSKRAGNVVLDPLLLMNLGAIQVKLGKYSSALEYYQKGRALFQEAGDEQRAAQIQSNIGAILVEYAGKIDEGLREINNALGVFRKVNDRTFEVFAAKVTAATLRYAGRHPEAERELSRAVAVAKERNMDRMMPLLAVDLAQSRLELNDYRAAEQTLRQAITQGSDKSTALPRIYLAQTYLGMGEFDSAQAELEKAEVIVTANGDDGQLPLLSQIHGEVEFQRHRYREARVEFNKAVAFWNDDLPDPSSIESKAFVGVLDALEGKSAAGRIAAAQSVEYARKIKLLSLEARCRLALASIDIWAKRHAAALANLETISPDAESRLGPETVAKIHFLRSQALAGRDDSAGADREITLARKQLEALTKNVSDAQRQALLARPDIQEIVR
jgi:tetratricopeptide (TPR) repeat protein